MEPRSDFVGTNHLGPIVRPFHRGALPAETDGLAHHLALDHVADVQLLGEEELLHDDEPLLEHRHDRGVTFDPGERGRFDGPSRSGPA